MPALTITQLMPLPGSRELPRKLWLRSEYQRLIEDGRIRDARHCELIEGEIVQQRPPDREHDFTSMRLHSLLSSAFGERRLQTHSPISLDDLNAPRPDVAVLRGTLADYAGNDPGPAGLLLLVEVATTTLRVDREIKSVLYARAGVPEYWVVDVAGSAIEAYRQPGPDGYAIRVRFSEHESVSPLSAPDAALAVAEMLPPSE